MTNIHDEFKALAVKMHTCDLSPKYWEDKEKSHTYIEEKVDLKMTFTQLTDTITTDQKVWKIAIYRPIEVTINDKQYSLLLQTVSEMFKRGVPPIDIVEILDRVKCPKYIPEHIYYILREDEYIYPSGSLTYNYTTHSV